MAKILLVEPPVGPFDVMTGTFGLPPPHHLERLAGALVDAHEVRILDMRIETDFKSEFKSFRPDVVGVTCVAANSRIAKSLLKYVKKLSPDTTTVLGGHHPSLAPRDCNESFVDFIVIGEGEVTFRELVCALENGESPETLPGIAARDEKGTFRINPRQDLIDLDTLPPPARHLTEKYRKKKLYYRGAWRPIDSIISTRGCPFKCNFCGLWKINRGQYRTRKPELIVDELETIKELYVGFVDDNSFDDVENSHKIADLIMKRGIKKTYELYARADTVANNPDLVKKWKKAGMQLLLIGLEAIDQSSLESMNKASSVEINRKAIEICHENDVEIAAYLVVRQDFSKTDFEHLSDFVQKNKLTHPVFTVLSPFPGTNLYATVKNKFITDRIELIDFYHTVLPTRLPLEEFYKEFQNLYRKAYPFKNFLKSIFKGKAIFSPRMIINTLKVRRKMAALFRHHTMALSHRPQKPAPISKRKERENLLHARQHLHETKK